MCKIGFVCMYAADVVVIVGSYEQELGPGRLDSVWLLTNPRNAAR